MDKKGIGLRSGLARICIYAAIIAIVTTALPSRADAFGVGSRGPDVYAVQGMLKSLGYYAGSIDGIYGNQTARGIKLFQQKYGLPITGAVDARTLQSILWAYGQLKIPAAPKPVPQQTPAPTPERQQTTEKLAPDEQLMLSLINQERSSRGIKPLIADLQLSHVAELKSEDMVVKKYFSHDSPTYGSPFEMLKQFGIDFKTAGENIACNQSVEAAHKSLMGSQGHRENILNPSFHYVGIGIVNGGPCGKMFTQLFIGR